MTAQEKEYREYRNFVIFRNDNDEHVESIRVDHVPVETFWRILSSPADDPQLVGGCYPFTAAHEVELRKLISIEFDFDKFAYFYEVTVGYE